MNNREVCEYIKTIDLLQNHKERYFSEICVEEGYGQTCGGYLTSGKTLSQKDHFLQYYGREDMAEKMPSYTYLRCPQLLLFIAEAAGVSREKIENAYNELKQYEDKNHLHKTEKHGSYLREIRYSRFSSHNYASMIWLKSQKIPAAGTK